REHYLRVIAELEGVTVSWEEMNSMDQVQALQLGQIDIGLVHTPLERVGLEARPVAREPLVAVLNGTHRYASAKALPLQALKDDHFILPPRHTAPGFYDN